GTPWLEIGPSPANVEDQLGDPGSILHLCRDLIRVRARLHTGQMQLGGTPPGVLGWRCGGATVAVNLSEASGQIPASGAIAVCPNRGRDGEAVAGTLTLAAMEGAIVT